MVQTLSSSAVGVGSIPGQEAKIPTCFAAEKPKHNKQKQYYDIFIKGFLKMVQIKKKKNLKKKESDTQSCHFTDTLFSLILIHILYVPKYMMRINLGDNIFPFHILTV